MELVPIIYTSVIIFTLTLVLVFMVSFFAAKIKNIDKIPPYEKLAIERQIKLSEANKKREEKLKREKSHKIKHRYRDTSNKRKEKSEKEDLHYNRKKDKKRIEIVTNLDQLKQESQKGIDSTSKGKKNELTKEELNKNILKSYSTQNNIKYYSINVNKEEKKKPDQET